MRDHRLAKRVAACLGLAAAIPAGASAAGDPTVDGLWRTEPKNGAYITVRIGPCGDDPVQRCGVVEGAHSGARPDVVGERLLWGLEREENGAWSDGWIRRPRTDDSYASSIELLDADHLKVKGCAIGGLICQSQTWQRVR